MTQQVGRQRHGPQFARGHVDSVFQDVVEGVVVGFGTHHLNLESEVVFVVQHEFWQLSLHCGVGFDFCVVDRVNWRSIVQGGGQFKPGHSFSAQVGDQNDGGCGWQARSIAQVAHSGHRQILVDHRNQGWTRQQALAQGVQASVHACCLAGSEGLFALLWRVVHVILDLRT